LSLAPGKDLKGEREPEAPSLEERGAGPLGFLLVAVLAVSLIFGFVRPFVVEPFGITTDSMDPTLRAGDSVLAAKFAYRLGDPRRGDVVLFEAPRDGAPTIKRVVGLPGDTVAVRDGVLFVNGEKKREGYVDYGLTDSTFLGPTGVPEGHVYLMGDNRANSLDSRSYGPVPEADLLGRVPLRVWPLDRAGFL
jgi:signal peptidase I